MKRFYKQPIIASLILTVLTYAIFCCCFTKPAQAKEALPSCHQSEDQHDKSQHNQDCERDCIPAFYKVEVSHGPVFMQLVSMPLEVHIVSLSSQISWTPATFPTSPPVFASTVPLYLKNSILRI